MKVKVKISIKDKELELTLDEAKELRDVLQDIVGAGCAGYTVRSVDQPMFQWKEESV